MTLDLLINLLSEYTSLYASKVRRPRQNHFFNPHSFNSINRPHPWSQSFHLFTSYHQCDALMPVEEKKKVPASFFMYILMFNYRPQCFTPFFPLFAAFTPLKVNQSQTAVINHQKSQGPITTAAEWREKACGPLMITPSQVIKPAPCHKAWLQKRLSRVGTAWTQCRFTELGASIKDARSLRWQPHDLDLDLNE